MVNSKQKLFAFFSTIVITFSGIAARAADKELIEHISDNSFLIEEAYNQDSGVVQHIFNGLWTNGSQRRGWAFSFTQEWPIFSVEHQFSYTIPASHLVDDGQKQIGVGDVLINYRYQALEESDIYPAFAPRFSLMIPSGNRNKGTGNGVVGYQWGLPFSKKVTSRLAAHFNIGLTYLPKVQVPLKSGGLSAKRSLIPYYIGGSAIFALSSRVQLMLEWLGNFDQSLDNDGKRVRAFQPTISPGIRTAVIDEDKLQIVVGVGIPIGLNRQTTNRYGALLYFSVEHGLF
jgi:hypothetical protein